MEKLYYFCWESIIAPIEGLFIAKEDDIKKLIGKKLDLSEYGESNKIRKRDIEEKNVSPSTLAELKAVFGDTICGFNPLDYV